MPIQTIYALGESNITVSGGAQLSGITQGDGSHLVGQTITLDNNSWEAVQIDDDDGNFQDNDGSQNAEGSQTFDGTSFGDNLRVEAEFRVDLVAPDGSTFTAYALNFNEPGVTSYSTVEGLVFMGGVGGFPPIGVPLTVVAAYEGPSVPYVDLASPPCFTTGCLIETPSGPRRIEDLQVGDLVSTLDNGPQPIRWIGKAHFPKAALNANHKLLPVRITAGALGQGLPKQDLLVSRQHRVMISSEILKRMFSLESALVAANALCGLPGIQVVSDIQEVTYIHIMLDRHEVLISEGAPTESLWVGDETKRSLPKAALEEINALFPELLDDETSPQPALRVLGAKDVKKLAFRHAKNAKPLLEAGFSAL